jgi:type I restriction enzyme S subunit
MQTVSGVGGSLLRAKVSEVAKIEIPVPPLAEQERIVKLLDEADALKGLRSRADQRMADFIPSLFDELFGDPNTNPYKLPKVSLGHLVSFRTGKLDSNAAVADGEYPFFTCSREASRIDTYAFDCEALLLAGNNAVGDYSVKYYNGRFNAYQRTYIITLLNPNNSYTFMQYALQARLRDLKRLSLGTNTKYLTLGILKNIEIPVPTPSQQMTFSQRISEFRELEAMQSSSCRRLANLFQALLHGAFKGEL